MAYGASLVDLSRRTATYVDKLSRPFDLPFEQPTNSSSLSISRRQNPWTHRFAQLQAQAVEVIE